MLFDDRHTGKAIAILRDARGLTQTELASAIGVKKSTMNKYEKGTTHVQEKALRKIAQALGHEIIEILDTAYAIFRFNHLRDESQRQGIDLEELIARYDPRAAVEEIHAAQASYLEKLREFERQRTELLGREKRNGFTVLRYVVETDEEKEARKEKGTERPSGKEA